MKRRKYWIGFVALVVVTASAVLLMIDRKVQTYAASTVFKEQGWQVELSMPVKSNSIEKGFIFVENAQGEKVDASIEYRNARKNLFVTGLAKGPYTLRIDNAAFDRKWVFLKEHAIEFKVIEELEKVTSKEQLKDYFKAVLAQQKRQEEKWFTSNSKQEFEMSSADTASTESSGTSYSTTNNQVEGIEEGDVTVTDGRYMYTMKENAIVIIDVQDANNMKQVSKMNVAQEQYPNSLMLHENYLLVTVDEYVQKVSANPHDGGTSLIKTIIYDVTDAKKPKLVREIGLEGYLLGLRKMNGLLYVVTSQSPNYWILEQGGEIDLTPALYDSQQSDKLQSMPLEHIRILPNTTEPSYINIASLDLTNLTDGALVTESFLGSSSQMYMSEQAIYVAVAKYEQAAQPANMQRAMVDMIWSRGSADTLVYKFGIDGQTIALTGQTLVPGELLNQFSMDEYNGHFRIATTKYSNNENDASENNVFVYDEAMNKVGSLTGLAKGERIYSARFMGEKAYVVTFKEVDPLFVIDLSEPTAPTVLGELKIPGFSNYLHPISDTHLVGIGYDTVVKVDEYTKEPFIQTKGMKLALFDVSDLANPKEQDAVIIGGRGTYSEVQHAHKALFRDPTNNLYGFPVVMYEDVGEYETKFIGSGAQVYRVTVEDGITLAGDLVNYSVGDMQYEDWDKTVQRIMYVDETLYTVARSEIKSYRYPNFTPVQTLPYE